MVSWRDACVCMLVHVSHVCFQHGGLLIIANSELKYVSENRTGPRTDKIAYWFIFAQHCFTIWSEFREQRVL